MMRSYGPDAAIDEEDEQFLDPRQRMVALGMEEERVIRPGPTLKARESAPLDGIIAPEKAPAPGIIVFTVAEMARIRGILHRSGQYKGRVDQAAIRRGTDLAYTTVVDLIRRPEEATMVYMDTLARLCAFFKCQPGELMQYQPNLASRAVMSESFKRGG